MDVDMQRMSDLEARAQREREERRLRTAMEEHQREDVRVARLRRAAAVNDRSLSERQLRKDFRKQYEDYFVGRTIMQALALWKMVSKSDQPIFARGTWRISGGQADPEFYKGLS